MATTTVVLSVSADGTDLDDARREAQRTIRLFHPMLQAEGLSQFHYDEIKPGQGQDSSSITVQELWKKTI